MNLNKFKEEFVKLGDNYKTKNVDKFNKLLIKQKVDVSFLKNIVIEHPEYHRTYFQVSLGLLDDIDKKMEFIEENFELLQDWWHTDQLPQFLGNELTFELAYEKAKKYVMSELPFVRRWGYILFIPRLVKDPNNIRKLISLLKNDDEYYVVMAEAWLISYLAMYDVEVTYEYLSKCDLGYNIVGKAIQKICDSFVISNENKERFKELRKGYK